MIEMIAGSEVARTALVTLAGTTLLALLTHSSARSRLSLRVRHAIGLCCFIMMLLMPLFAMSAPSWGGDARSSSEVSPELPRPVLEPVSGASTPDQAVLPAAREESVGIDPWLAALLLPLLWFAGFAATLFRRILDLRDRAALWRTGAAPSEPALAAISRLIHESGVERTVDVRVSERASVPMTWGVLRPRFVLPSVSSRWTDAQLAGVIVHECSHIRRLDALSRTLAELAVIIHWFNPLIAGARRELLHLAEEIADAEVVRKNFDRRDYVLFLVSLARAAGLVRSVEAMARRSGLERRAGSLMSAPSEMSRSKRWFSVALLSLSVLAIPSAAGFGRVAAIEPDQADDRPAAASSITRIERTGTLTRGPRESESEYSGRLRAAAASGMDGSNVLKSSLALRTNAERQRLFEQLASTDPSLLPSFVDHLDLFSADAAAIDMIVLICEGATLTPEARSRVIERASRLRAGAAREAAIRALVSTQPLDNDDRRRLAAVASTLPSATRESYLRLVLDEDAPAPPAAPSKPDRPALPTVAP